MKAIRIDGKEVIRGNLPGFEDMRRHEELFFAWLAREGMSEDQGEAALDANRVEWGAYVWDSAAGAFGFVKGHSWRDECYKTVAGVRSGGIYDY